MVIFITDIDFIIRLTMTKTYFFKKRNLCKLCHIESIKYAHVKLLIFYNKIFNDIREAKKIDLFSMEYK